MNGVDLTSGAFTVNSTDVVIGQPEMGGLIYARSFYRDGWRDSLIGTIKSSGATYTVSFGGGSNTFTLTGTLGTGTFASDQADGSTLTYSSGTQVFTYTTRDGAVALFAKSLAETAPLEANEGKVTSITLPTGETTTFTYKTVTISSVAYNRLQSVTNNLGYQLKLEYSANTATATGQLPAFRLITKVTGLNNAIDYCDPTADSCTFSQIWPHAVYTAPTSTTRTVTDTLSRVTRFTYDSSGRIVGVKRPSASTDTATITYDTTLGNVASVSNGSATWTYIFDPDASGLSTIVTDPLSHTRTLSIDAAGLVTGDWDALNRVTYFQYDSSGRLTRVTSPEGDYVQYVYDSRGNQTSVTRVAKSGSGLSNIVTYAGFSGTCSNAVVCNRPNTTTDVTGAVTDYTYDSTHGGLLTVTLPAPVTSGVRPQTRVTYAQKTAWYKNSSGTVVAAGTSIYRPTATSVCATTSSCAGGADETKTTVVYGASSVANNLLVTSSSTGAGNASAPAIATTTITYSDVGDPLTVDGPLSGTADTTRYRYDNGRQLIGVVGPDPDGGGSLKHRGTRYAYNLDGQVTMTEAVTVNSQSDGDWASATSLQQRTATYDTLGRVTKSVFTASSATYSVVQYSYDNANRLDCSTLRMNAAAFASPPAACSLGTTGANGPDLITKYTYSNADEVTKVTSAYGTALQSDSATLTYNSRGTVATAADALGALTTYEYDGFGRLKKTRFPAAGSRTTSSTTDYAEITYDAYGRVSQARARDGQTFGLTYDLLSRPIAIDAPSGTDDVSFTYNNLGQLLAAAKTGHTLTYTYDAFGRTLSQASPLGTVAYEYDLAGQRTKMTWPDSYRVDYEYDAAGGLKVIRENGATAGAGVLATFAYDDFGRRTTLSRGNGVTTTYGFDNASRLTSLALDLAGTSQDQTWTYSYSAGDQAISRVGSNGAYAPAAPANGSRTYGSNGLNQLTTSGSLNLSYDSRGNLTSDGVNTYSYDAANRLLGMSGVTLSYDPAGRLFQTTGSSTTKFLYDGADMVGEYNSSGTLLRRYVHGPGLDEPLVWYEGTGTTDRRWLLSDRLGSVAAVTNGSGAATDFNSYDEYGVPGASNVGRFQYTGQTWMAEVGLYNYKARAYSPNLGRFLQADPSGYGDGMNMYAYVGNDPINRVDPTGKKWVENVVCRTAPTPKDFTEVEPVTITAKICRSYFSYVVSLGDENYYRLYTLIGPEFIDDPVAKKAAKDRACAAWKGFTAARKAGEFVEMGGNVLIVGGVLGVGVSAATLNPAGATLGAGAIAVGVPAKGGGAIVGWIGTGGQFLTGDHLAPVDKILGGMGLRMLTSDLVEQVIGETVLGAMLDPLMDGRETPCTKPAEK